jgi:hypothetical protein
MISQMTDAQIKAQLGQLKALTVRTGIVHEAQVLQLQMWPMVVFPHAMTATADINTENRSVFFKIHTSLSALRNSKSHVKAVGFLTEWIRNILWDDTAVNIQWKFSNNDKPNGSRNSKPKRRGKKATR